MKKGISIISLGIYVTIFLTIIGILIAFNVNVFSKVNDFVIKNKLNYEYIKFNKFITILAKENNYIEEITDGSGNIIIFFTKYDKRFEKIIEIDEETGEEYISLQHWINDGGIQSGYITYNEDEKKLYYVKNDTKEKVLLSSYISEVKYSIGEDNKSIEIQLKYFVNDIEYFPKSITYVMGRGY